MQGETMPFHFTGFGVTKVTMFHQHPNERKKNTNIIFIPQSGTHQLNQLRLRLDRMARVTQGWLYALTFPRHTRKRKAVERKLIQGAYTFLRAGCDTLNVVTCDHATKRAVALHRKRHQLRRRRPVKESIRILR